MKAKYKQLVDLYIRAKDRHQPHLMRLAFAQNASLEMIVNTDAIDFPSKIIGLEGITETLVKDFHNRFDNVYTFCINESTKEFVDEMRCTWLVGMTDAESGSLRMGYGEYQWQFTPEKTGRKLSVIKLRIIINSMEVLPAEAASSILPWLDSLPHPWISVADLSMSTPDVSSVREFLDSGWRIS